MKKRSYTITILLLLGAFLFTPSAFAQSNETAQGMGFTFDLQFPNSQQGEAGFWDLLLPPNTSETMTITLRNTSPQPITVDMRIVSAKTTAAGVISYTPNELAFDESLKHNIEELIEAPEYVELMVGEERTITLDVAMPTEEFDGMLLGSLYMQRRPTEEEDAQTQGNILNRFSFVVGIVLRNNNNATEKNVVLNEVIAGLDNQHTAILIDLSNVQSEILPDVSIEAGITRAGEDEVLFLHTQSQMRMAPNTRMLFPVQLRGQRIQPGDYTAHIVLYSEGDRWEWNENFTVTADEAREMNESAVGLLPPVNNGVPPWIFASGAGIVALGGYMIYSVAKKNKELKRQLEAMQATDDVELEEAF